MNFTQKIIFPFECKYNLGAKKYNISKNAIPPKC